MHIKFNNSDFELPGGATVQSLIEKIAPPQPNIAVVVNHRITNRAKWPELPLSEGDKVVMFEMVAGG